MSSPPISAVRTTGIYCRDGCSGRPSRRNVTEYASPVAAEAAGYRACLRCRPDRLPPTSTAGDVPGLVAHALLLVNEGALDQGTEEHLAQRLAISGRHLRRLFLEHIGATPDFVARSRRAHFARRLLDETDLSVAQIAFSAGFSSVRQMNRLMVDTFRRSPTQLRARRRLADRLVADGGLVLRVPYRGSIDFAGMLDFLRPRAIPGVEAVDGATYRRTITTCGHPGAIEVTDAGDRSHLLMNAHLPTFNALIDDVARVRRVFGLDQPAPVALHPLMNDPLLAPITAARPGLRVPGAWDRFEVAVRIVIGQGISVPAASKIAGRLAEQFGAPLPGLEPMGLSRVFPSARRLAGAHTVQLAAIGLTRGRADAIRALARAYSSGHLPLDGSLRLESMLGCLTALPGVGPWTANFIALRAAGHLDAFPAEDLGLRRAMARLLGRESLSAKDLSNIAERWRPYRGVAAMYLWSSLRD